MPTRPLGRIPFAPNGSRWPYARRAFRAVPLHELTPPAAVAGWSAALADKAGQGARTRDAHGPSADLESSEQTGNILDLVAAQRLGERLALMLLGQRRAEAGRMRWSDLARETGALCICQASSPERMTNPA
jgi:hypothetical protein